MAHLEAESEDYAVRTWTDPDTGRDLIPLDELLDLARDTGLDVGDLPQALHRLMRAGAEVLVVVVDGAEVVTVRLPEGWH